MPSPVLFNLLFIFLLKLLFRLSTARLLGEAESAAVYDSMKTPGRESIVDAYCNRARTKCPPEKKPLNNDVSNPFEA